MQTIIDNVKTLGPILVILWLAVIILAVWKPQRYPEEIWIKMHHALIFHGRNCCTARNPWNMFEKGHLCDKIST